MRASLPRFGSSRGISTVVGTIFLVLVVFVICTNVFLWTMIQNTRYNQAVKESHQMDANRFNERVVISRGAYSVAGDRVRVDATLSNEGPVPVQVITLWVVDATINNYGFKNGLNINLNAGDSRTVSGEMTIPGTESNHRFNIWYVTARGNLVSFVKERYVTISNMTSVMGPVLLNYQSLRWISETGNSGTWEIPKNEKIKEWFLSLTNYGDEDITLSTSSMFRLEAGAESNQWYLKEKYTLAVGQEVTITFVSKTPSSMSVGTYPTTITLVGKYASDQPYGQMFSFVAIEVV
jgi:hypothetical protein